MRTFPNRSQMAANAARQPNPAWPWIAGGAVAAAGVGAYFCWPRRVATDSVSVEGISMSRTIDFKGCGSQLPYEVTLSGNGITVTQSFKTLEEAQGFSPADEASGTQQPPRGLQANPSGDVLAPTRFSFVSAPARQGGGKVPLPRGPGKLPPPGCPPGYMWDPVLGACQPGKAPPPRGPGKVPVPRPRPVPVGPTSLGVPAAQPNPLVTIFSPATYSYPSAPYLYPQIAHGGYGTAMLV